MFAMIVNGVAVMLQTLISGSYRVMKSEKRVLKILALLLSAIMLLAGCNAESAETETGDESQSNGKVMILYTSDMHCGVDEGFGLAGLQARTIIF